MRSLLRLMSNSRAFQLFLILVAAVLSLLPMAAEKRQGNSITWTVEGDRIRCEYFQVPSFSHVRTYEIAKVDGVTKAPDSTDSSVEVVRLRLNGLNLNIPSQSSTLIWNFDSYLKGLQRFHGRVRSGETDAEYSWYHPWLIVGVASIAMAVACWVSVFVVLLSGPGRDSAPPQDGQDRR